MWEPARLGCCTDFLCTLLTKAFSSSPTSHLKNCAPNCISRSAFLLPPHGYIFSSTPFVRFYGFTVRLPSLGRTGRSVCLYVYVFICVCIHALVYVCIYVYTHVHICTPVWVSVCLPKCRTCTHIHAQLLVSNP